MRKITTRYERYSGHSFDPDEAVAAANAAYSENGRRRPPIDPAYPTDLAFPNLHTPHSCPCGLRFQVRRDRDAHTTRCEATHDR